MASTSAAQFTNFAADVPQDYVVIGGGVRGAAAPQAHLLIASYPSTDRTAWVVSTKEVQHSAPTAITAWALALKVAGLTRAQLLANMTYRSTTSATSANPSATSLSPEGYVQLGRGFQLVTATASNVAWASYPTSSTAWTVAAQERGVSSLSAIRSYVIGIRINLPVGLVTALTATLAQVQPAAKVRAAAGHVLTGCGARVSWEGGAGTLLWQIEPQLSATSGSCDVRGTEHIYGSPATVGAQAIGIRIN